MSVIAVLGDTLAGPTLINGTITNCVNAGVYETTNGPMAFVGDQVTVTVQEGDKVLTYVGKIVSGNPRYGNSSGNAIALLGESRWVANGHSGTIVGPGSPTHTTV